MLFRSSQGDLSHETFQHVCRLAPIPRFRPVQFDADLMADVASTTPTIDVSDAVIDDAEEDESKVCDSTSALR